jgi:hypothetical protein
MNQAEFNEIVTLLRSDDPMNYEDGYHSLTGRVDEVLEQLIELEQNEKDEEMRSKFLELIGESVNPKAIELLETELKSPLYEVRMWAYSSLCYSESKEANLLAEQFKRENSNEEFL